MSLNFFTLLQLPETFVIDLKKLDQNYQNIQKEIHPDRFASLADEAKIVSIKKTAEVNDAYQTLKSPIRRAEYLLHLYDIDIHDEKYNAVPQDFLMQQMEWREALDDCKALKDTGAKIVALEILLEQVDASHAQALARAAHLMDADHNYAAAVGQVRALMFIEKFAHEVQHGLDACT